MSAAQLADNLLAAMDAHPLLERLVFASVELVALAVLVALAIAVLRIRSPRAWAMLWLIVLAKPIVTLAFGAVVPVLRFAPPEYIVAEDATVQELPMDIDAAPFTNLDGATANPVIDAPVPVQSAIPPAAPAPARPPIDWHALATRVPPSLWFAGVALLVLSTVIDRVRLRRLLSRTSAPSEHAASALTQVVASLNLPASPPLRVTAELESPAVVGWFRSSIVIPRWLEQPENATALAWALRHELTHLKHRDPAANALRRLAQILFFFHPVTWWASRRWEAAVELACDRAVVHTDDDVTAYAEQLYEILVQARQQRRSAMATGLFATRTQINTRIAALLGDSLNTPARLGIATAVTLTFFAGAVFAVGGAIADREKAIEESVVTEAEQAELDPQDPALQATCEALLEGKEGAIVVLNADTGAVLAIASVPYGTIQEVVASDAARQSQPDAGALQVRPPYSRAYREEYPPGSLFKVVLAAAALEEGLIDAETTYYCGGSFRINGAGRDWKCWNHSGHGRVNVTEALTYSCDVFFYNVGLALGVKRISAWAAEFGLGELTGIDLPREMPGLIPDPEWKKQITNNNAAYFEQWYPGDTVNLSIGQGMTRTTPLQNAVMMAAIVNGGYRITPRMNPALPVQRGERMLSDATLEILQAALRRAVEKAPPDFPAGTGWRAGIDGIEVIGKTGNAQVMSLHTLEKYGSEENVPYAMRDHAWFVAGVTDREPKIAVCVLVEHGMHGSMTAAEIARTVIAQAYGVPLSAGTEAAERPAASSRRFLMEKAVPRQERERQYLVHFNSGQSQSADFVEERESYYILTYGEHNFQVRKNLVRAVVKLGENEAGDAVPGRVDAVQRNERAREGQADLVLEKYPARTLNFPDDRSLGALYLADPIDYDTAPNKALLMYRLDAWEKLGEARGRVEIPAGKIVRLSAKVAWTDEAFAALPANGIQHLTLSGDTPSRAGMPHHAVWKGLSALGSYGRGFATSELPYLKALSDLRWLDLRGARLERQDLDGITALTQLRCLSLEDADLSGAGPTPLKGFAKLGRLQLLDLSRSGVAGTDLRDLSSLRDLVSLNLDCCSVTNDDLDALSALDGLETLSLERTGITDGYEEHLSALKNLASIKADYTDTSDAEHRATAMGGRILADDGKPAPGVYVKLGTDGPNYFSSARTGADGRWQTLVQTGWSRAAVQLSGGGYVNEVAPTILSETEAAQLREGNAEFIVKKGTSLSGVVLDPAGKPVAGARIRRDNREMPREQFHEGVRTDEAGRFTIEHLDDSQELALAVLSEHHAPYTLHVPAGPEKAHVTVTLSDGMDFHGEVRDADEEPVEGVVITASSWRPGTYYAPLQDTERPRVAHAHRLFHEARSDAEGKFTLSNLPDYGKVQFSLRKTDYYSASLSAEPPYYDDGIVYVVPDVPFRGRVVDASTGDPVANYEVEFTERTGGRGFTWYGKNEPMLTRDADTGEFSARLNLSLDAATRTEFAARITAEGYKRATSEVVSDARLGELVTIELQPLNLSQIDTLAPATDAAAGK